MTVQAFESDTVIILDISQPIPDEITWQVPPQAEVIQELDGKLSFSILNEGEYQVKLKARKGACFNTKTRTIRIFDREDIDQTDSLLHYLDSHLIREMTVYPNPNFGDFKVDVKLSKKTDVTLSVVRFSTATEVYRQEKTGQKAYTFDLKFSGHVQDVYIVTLRSGKSEIHRKVLIMN